MQDARASQDGAIGPPAPEGGAIEGAGPARLVDEHGLEVVPSESQPLGVAETEQPSWLPTGLALLGFVIIVWTLVRSIRKRGAPGAMDREPAERLSDLRERSEAKATVEGLMADALELTQRLAAQLDAKAERVEQLLDRAERRLAELEAAEARQPPAPPAGRWAGGGDVERPMPRLAQGGSESGGSGVAIDPLHRQVYRLSDEGLDVLEISRRLDQPRGQVELILALRRA